MNKIRILNLNFNEKDTSVTISEELIKFNNRYKYPYDFVKVCNSDGYPNVLIPFASFVTACEKNKTLLIDSFIDSDLTPVGFSGIVCSISEGVVTISLTDI